MNVEDTLQKKGILICCGSGGVGKTSVSASLGLRAAQLGLKSIVMTIDPARRLATALGIGLEENAETRISPELLEKAGIQASGEFWAMMLNAKQTFDSVVNRNASSPEARDRLLQNPAYMHGSTAMVESPEYMAMEKLHELYTERDYDLIIVDTPPLKHALDFLTAPARFPGMLSGNPLIKILTDAMAASAGSTSFFSRLGKASLFRLLSLVTGEQAIHDAAEFFMAFKVLMGGFTRRANEVERIFKSDACRLLIVTSPNLITIEEALFLHKRTSAYGMRMSGFIVNRAEPDYFEEVAGEPDPEVLLKELASKKKIEGIPTELLQILLENMRRHELHRRSEEKNIALLQREISDGQFLCRIPELPSDIHDIKGLAQLGQWFNTK